MSSSTVYQLMKQAARGVLEAYETDLTIHDRAFLRTYRGLFIWGVRPWGTHIFPATAASRPYLTITWFDAVTNTHPDIRLYLGDTARRTLTPVTHESAREFVLKWSVGGSVAHLVHLAEAQKFDELEQQQADMTSLLITNRALSVLDAIRNGLKQARE